MTKIKLTDETIVSCESVMLVCGVLQIATKEKTVEELAAIFQDKQKTSNIILLTESGKESGYKTGFTSFAGITYGEDGTKTVELFQPKDITEARISSAEGAAYQAGNVAEQADKKADTVREEMAQAITEITLAMSVPVTTETPAESPADETAPTEEV